MSAYPMTPATSIIITLPRRPRELPVHFEQAEDQIAAVNMAPGGLVRRRPVDGGHVRRASATQERVSLAGMTDADRDRGRPEARPVHRASRPGPNRGISSSSSTPATANSPGLFAPGSIDETIALSRISFDLADRFQIPVFLADGPVFRRLRSGCSKRRSRWM